MNDIEVNVRYKPIREISILQKAFFSSPDDLARYASIMAGGRQSGLYWAEGIVFLYYPLQSSTETTAKALVENGRVYWVFVGYAPMSKYQSIIETKEKIMVPVINMSSNDLLSKAALWLKNLTLKD